MLPTRNYSAHDVGTTMRPTSTALFTIDSEDRYDNYTERRSGVVSPYDFSITLPASLMNGFFTRLSLTEIVFPWVIPNITAKTNSIILKVEFDNGVDPVTYNTHLITIPQGFYTPSALAAKVASEVRFFTANNFNMNYGSDSAVVGTEPPIFEYDVSGSAQYSVAFEPVPFSGTAYPFSDLNRQLFDVLGFCTAPFAAWSSTKSYSVGDKVVYQNLMFTSLQNNNLNNVPPYGAAPTAFWDFYVINNPYNNIFKGNGFSGQTYAQGTRYVDIVCSQLSYNQALKDSSSQKTVRDALCRLYIIDPYNVQSTTPTTDPAFAPPGTLPTTIYRNFTQPKQIQWLPNQPITGSLRFQVFDDEGDILTGQDFVDEALPPNATNWSMTLLVSEN